MFVVRWLKESYVFNILLSSTPYKIDQPMMARNTYMAKSAVLECRSQNGSTATILAVRGYEVRRVVSVKLQQQMGCAVRQRNALYIRAIPFIVQGGGGKQRFLSEEGG
eukprot:CAMPEP_0197855386 /NCGR_PEP_ID=MMETSP1438-20131217/26548_1 /TAXON_ID=1461541 /ORGANISM="Pterosperma sp., Strain CCMP1384" /LENGTH=107 /DNA_ID=CAMNT_0043470473 /DNA_START=33 /DNA_END=352 /DNA_ORIENTATION=-